MKKLNSNGVAHIVMILFVVIFAVLGVGYLVASHADSCNPVSGPMSGPVSGGECGQTQMVTCTVNGVPSKPAYNTLVKPTVTLTNTGSGTLSAGTIAVVANQNGSGYDNTISYGTVAAGASVTIKLPSLYVQHASNPGTRGTITITSLTPSFNCQASFRMPMTSELAASCSVEVPKSPVYGQIIKPRITVTNLGNQPFVSTVSIKEYINGSFQYLKVGNVPVDGAKTVDGIPFTIYAYNANFRDQSYDVFNRDATSPTFQCSGDFDLPTKPVATSDPAGKCDIVLTRITANDGTKQISGKVTITNTGLTSFTPNVHLTRYVNKTATTTWTTGQRTISRALAANKSVSYNVINFKIPTDDSVQTLRYQITSPGPDNTPVYTCQSGIKISNPSPGDTQ